MLNHHAIIATRLIEKIANKIACGWKRIIFEDPFGASFPTSLPCPPLAVAEHAAVPHAYPDGQQPPPSVASQLDHPVAHDPVNNVV
jgi:hypothetical protein